MKSGETVFEPSKLSVAGNFHGMLRGTGRKLESGSVDNGSWRFRVTPSACPVRRKETFGGMDFMVLSIIGSGLGRTGTKSLKEALEQLGFGPCHHMHEVLSHPEQVRYWQQLAEGEQPDWNDVFSGYRSQVDWPGAHFWRELAEAFPEAKVIHTVRPEEKWWASFSASIARLMQNYQGLPLPPHAKDMLDAWAKFAGTETFEGRYDDRNVALAAFRLRTQQVQEALTPKRLLIFDVAEGWEPLCRFLGVPAPSTPFPHHNLRADFWEALGGQPS